MPLDDENRWTLFVWGDLLISCQIPGDPEAQMTLIQDVVSD